MLKIMDNQNQSLHPAGHFTLLPGGGLGNRLLSLASASRLAKKRNWSFDVHWEPNFECFCSFSDLFEVDLPPAPDRAPEKIIHRTFDANQKRGGIHTDDPIPDTRGPFAIYSNAAFLDDNEYCHLGRHEGPELLEFRDALMRLQPKQEILDTVKSFVAENRLKGCVGIHIRRGYLDERFPKHLEWLRMFSDEFYASLAERVLASGRRLFICSDQKSLVSDFSHRFGALNFPTVSFEKNSDPNAIKSAFSEILALSQCTEIISTYGSTFSYLASILGRRINNTLLFDQESSGIKIEPVNFGVFDLKTGRATRPPISF